MSSAGAGKINRGVANTNRRARLRGDREPEGHGRGGGGGSTTWVGSIELTCKKKREGDYGEERNGT